jgi:hypothetical protein
MKCIFKHQLFFIHRFGCKRYICVGGNHPGTKCLEELQSGAQSYLLTPPIPFPSPNYHFVIYSRFPCFGAPIACEYSHPCANLQITEASQREHMRVALTVEAERPPIRMAHQVYLGTGMSALTIWRGVYRWEDGVQVITFFHVEREL